jgi:serine/threonine-protein kinase
MVFLTALTSRTIFGLRARVREAVQLGQYTLLEKIGEGGMGVVYRARHALLRRPTAIKLLPPDRAGRFDLARFEREAQLTSLLTHPNTVSIYDYGRTADGVLYYAMEYLDGIDLETLVRLDGPQEPGRVVHLLRQMCSALDEAHQIGLIHRDVKPGNVLLCARGGDPDFVKVVDFGLVKSLDGPIDAAATAANQMVGTPLYMSPEAILTPDKVDARSDVYAVGAVGYFLLTGAAPFVGATTIEICGHHLHSLPLPPSERLGSPVPPRLERLILRCLDKSPDARPRGARSLAEELAGCTDVPPWSLERAAAWWRARQPDGAARRAHALGNLAGTPTVVQTLAIDLRPRLGHTAAPVDRPRAN